MAFENKHLDLLYRFLDPDEKARLKRAFASPKNRQKWLARLAHNIEMNPRYVHEPTKGQRDENSLYDQLNKLGAPEQCYIIASDHELDDQFLNLKDVLFNHLYEFGHGTIISCIAGELALFRTAYPHKNYLLQRKL